MTQTSEKFYRILSLTEGRHLSIASGEVVVDLDSIDSDLEIYNDRQFLQAVEAGRTFWISGGGGYIISGRWLTVVKRSENARVNPSHLSLITGRSDSKEEWQNPRLLLRELFEELFLFSNNIEIRPMVPGYESMFQRIRDEQIRIGLVPLMPVQEVEARAVEMGGETWLRIKSGGRWNEFRCVFFSGQNRDCNALFFYNIEFADLESLRARDCEARTNGTDRQNRTIYLLDIESKALRNLTDGSEVTSFFPRTPMLDYVVGELATRLPRGEYDL